MGNWIFNKHTKDLLTLDSIIMSIAEKRTSSKEIAEQLISEGYYTPRKKINKTTISNKFKELQFYNLVYKNGDKYILSTTGNYYFKALCNDDKTMKEDVFVNTIFNVQFPHEYNRSDSNLYPFRIILQLMLEEILDYKLYNCEIIAILYNYSFTSEDESLRQIEYMQLVDKIKIFRMMPDSDKRKILEGTKSLADRIHQLDYYVMPLLNMLNIINIYKDSSKFTKYSHPQKKGTHSPKTNRKYYETIYTINDCKQDYIEKLLNELPAYSMVQKVDCLLHSEYIQLVFNTISNTFLEMYERDEITKTLKYLKQLSREVVYHSENTDSDSPAEFEVKLCDLFNMFNDIRAERISGPGKTDLECFYSSQNYKFNVDAKSSGKKLNSINAGRLTGHMNKSNSRYTIVIAPDFTPSVIKHDILNSKIVTVRASILCEYIQHMAVNDNLSYKSISDIIYNDLGKDISNKLNEEIAKQYGFTQANFY